MNRFPVQVGSVVVSKAGRDEGRRFIVIQEVDQDFVLVANGHLRGMDHPKKKRRKHLRPTGQIVDALRERLSAALPVEDHELRSWLSEEEEQLVEV